METSTHDTGEALPTDAMRERSHFNSERWDVLTAALADLPDGCLVELGVHRGGVLAYLNRSFPNRHTHGYDAFELGLTGTTPIDQLEEGILAADSGEVWSWLCSVGAGGIHLIVGDIRQTLPTWHHQVAFASVDLNLYAPTLHALRWLNEHTVSGSVVLVDDRAFPGVAAAIAEHDWTGWTTSEAGYMWKAVRN